MLIRILSSSWVVVPVVVIALVSVVLLYLRGRATEALLGGVLLAIAVYLIVRDRGNSRNDDITDSRPDR